MAFKIIIALISLNIMIEDFKYRSIHWLNIVALGAAVVLGILLHAFTYSTQDFLFNLLFLGIQFISLTIYFSIKQGRLINITYAHIGSGDIMYLLVLSPLFSPTAYVIFTLGSLIMALLGVVMYQWRSGRSVVEIPLASFMAIWLIVSGVLIQFYPDVISDSENLIASWTF
jgi:hypothetical protein